MVVDFKSLIIAESKISSGDYSDRRKLIELSNIYHSASQKLLIESIKLLEIATVLYTKDPQGDVLVNSDFTKFLDGLMRQSVSSNFFTAYINDPNKSKARSLVDDKTSMTNNADSGEAELKNNQDVFAIKTLYINEIAEVEDVEQWSKDIVDVMKQNQKSYSFSELVEISHLSPARVFLALFLVIVLNYLVLIK